MSKYRIHIENIGPDADWNGTDIECNDFAILADKNAEEYSTVIHEMSLMNLAGAIAEDDDIRIAARVGLAMYEGFEEKKKTENPIISILKSLSPDGEGED